MKSNRPKFKPYHQQQLMVLPPTFDELIAKDHPVRVVNQVIEMINLNPLYKKFKDCGCPGYHPRMLLKLLVYGYLSNIYSSRKLEAAAKENIHFMWLCAMDQPDHNTINRFRSDRLKGMIKNVFTQVVMMLVESGHVDLQQIYTDGSKIESTANRYTFVWSKTIKNNKERIARQLEELWQYTQQVAAQELQDISPTQYASIDPEEVRKTVELIDQALKDKPVPKKVMQKVRYARKNWPEKLKEYKEKEEKLGERNSYSKTDEDATFMRMKEDHMGNGQLKPAYNIQVSTNNQIITHYSVHQNPADTETLKPHLDGFQAAYGTMPGELIADAGYGSEENYEFLEKNNVEAYVKDNYFDRDLRRKSTAKSMFYAENLHYNKELNCYYCPMGQAMTFIGNKQENTKAGYKRTLSRYRAKNCEGCPMRGMCYKAKGNRVIDVSHALIELRNKARERLLSEKGVELRKQRAIEVEPVFGMIKQNRGFRRFMLRGLEKVGIELGLLAIAHNLKKMVIIDGLNAPFKQFKRSIEEILTEFDYQTTLLLLPVNKS